jgi:hypothetical protein
VPTVNDGLKFSITIDDADSQVAVTGVPESTAAVDLAEEIRERRNSRDRQAYAARVAEKAVVSAKENATADWPLPDDAEKEAPKDFVAQEAATAAERAEEGRQRRNLMNRQSYVARVGAKAAASTLAEADRVGAEDAADWRRLQQNESRRDRYNERVHPFGIVADEFHDPEDRAEECRLNRNAGNRYSHQARIASSAMELNDADHDAREAATAASRQRHVEASRVRRVAFKEVRQHWDSAHPCNPCGHVWLVSASAGLRQKCCMGGILWDMAVSPFILGPLPSVLEHGLYDKDFVRSSNQYNNILSLGAVGVDNAKQSRGWDKIVGHHAVRLSGRTYHFLPQVNTRGGLQYILHDGSQGTLTDVGRERQVDEATLMELYEELQETNPLCRSYAAIGSMADRLLLQLGEAATLEQVNTILPQLNRATVEFDVSAITIDRMTGNHFLRVTVKGSRASATIPSTSELFEPIGYPLLFPRGETGWGEMYRKGRDEFQHPCMKIEFLDYLASRMLMPERHLDFEATNLEPMPSQVDDPDWGRFGRVCTKSDSGETFFMPTNRFERLHRLGQIYLVDMTSRAIDHRLKFIKDNQKHIFGGVARQSEGVDDNSDDDVPQPDQVQYGIQGNHIGRIPTHAAGRGRHGRGKFKANTRLCILLMFNF